ncbi:MAG: hypothetical protein CL947_02450 [Epsilonproteobacteria bacterium]|nr:hypothetical protein [Campylobacterota bacterium]|tara:strand:- start:399 stop:1313 length:915 start_codon:yes stop_codon:yes gene_type:complete
MKLYSYLLLHGLIVLHNFYVFGEEVYPFSKEPSLSWAQFEINFRETHSDIEIPQIILDNDCNFAPMYIFDKQDPDLKEFNKNKKVSYEPPCIIMNTKIIEAAGCMSSAGCAWILLHETGHHHYGDKRRTKDHDQAELVSSVVKYLGGGLSLTILANSLYKMATKPIKLRQLSVPLLVGIMLNYHENFLDGIKGFVGTRPGEYEADRFANDHATKEELQAILECYSSQRRIHEFVAENIQKEDSKEFLLDSMEGCSVGIVNYVGYMFKHLILLEYHASRLVPSHPSYQTRYDMSLEALKNRFSVK